MVAHAPLFQTKNVPINLYPHDHISKYQPMEPWNLCNSHGGLKVQGQNWHLRHLLWLPDSNQPGDLRMIISMVATNIWEVTLMGLKNFFNMRSRLCELNKKNPEIFQKKTPPSPPQSRRAVRINPQSVTSVLRRFCWNLTSNCCFKVVLMIMIYEIIPT